jgi:nucleotidyltransferase/DNA polymerase involved in DNA repair
MDITCLLVPNFPIALARRDYPGLRGKPVVVGDSPEEHTRVTTCSAEAAALGITVGMPLRQALAHCPHAAFVPLRETELLIEAARLADLLQSVSPTVEEIEPGHLHMEVRGLARLHGMSEEEYFAELHQLACETTGLAVSLGTADTVFVAHAAAAVGADSGHPVTAVLDTDAHHFLASLPVGVLPVGPAMHQRLRLLGLERLRDIAALSRSAMQAQFGPDGARAWELAHGRDDSAIVPARQSVQVDLQLDLPASASTTDVLVVATRELLQRALEHQELRGHSLRRLDWLLLLENGEQITRRFVFREPTRDAARILFIVRTKAEQLQLTSPVSTVGITLSNLCSEYGHQSNLWPTGPRRERELHEAIEQLNTRMGSPQVYQVIEVQPWSRVPERQLALVVYGG